MHGISFGTKLQRPAWAGQTGKHKYREFPRISVSVAVTDSLLAVTSSILGRTATFVVLTQFKSQKGFDAWVQESKRFWCFVNVGRDVFFFLLLIHGKRKGKSIHGIWWKRHFHGSKLYYIPQPCKLLCSIFQWCIGLLVKNKVSEQIHL